jgi:hypothetical protein
VLIIGHLPHQLDPAAVTHIPTVQDRSKFENIGTNVEALMALDLESVVWLNDDMYLVEDWVGPVPLWARDRRFLEVLAGLNADTGSAEHRAYVRGMVAQYEVLADWGFDNPWCTDLHLPIPLDLERLRAVTSRAWADYPDLERGHFRALYGAGLEVDPVPDVKHNPHRGLPTPTRGWVSSGPVAWNVGEMGKFIRRRYWRPSRWELPR